MPRYELKDGKSSKFWEINLSGDTYTVRYGKIGTDGQQSTKVFASDEEALVAVEKITVTKVKKGYLLTGDSEIVAESSGDEPDLEESIKLNPDNIEEWQVYADYLQTKNDPHGELIALGIAIEKSPNSKRGKEAQTRFDQIFKENIDKWLGKAAKYLNATGDDDIFTLEWKYGYLLKARISTHYDYEGPAVHELLRELLKNPVGNFIQNVTIGVTDGLDGGDLLFGNILSEIAKGGKINSLKKLFIGDFGGDECEISWSTIGNCGKLYPVLPNLEYLKLHGGEIELGKLNHKKLKTLIIECGGLPAEAVKAIGNANLPALETLEVWFGAEDYGAGGNVKMLKQLLTGKGYPALKSLGLKNSEFENEIAQALVDAPILKRISQLDLSMGTMSDVGAKAILDNEDSFKHLDHINLKDNYISDELAKQLKKLFGNKINIQDQDTVDEYDGEEYTYVSVGE